MARVEAPEPSPGPAPVAGAPAVDTEALLDGLAERLERAAAELGIDTGA
jgi:hypothetical protein